MEIFRPESLLQMARDIADRQPDFHAVKGPGKGDYATNAYMADLRSAAIETFGIDLSEFRACDGTSFAADFYFPEEGVLVEIALGLPNPNSEFEKDIIKALMAKEFGHHVERLMFISRPGAVMKCNQPGRQAMIQWANDKHQIRIDVYELNGERRPPRVRRKRSADLPTNGPSVV